MATETCDVFDNSSQLEIAFDILAHDNSKTIDKDRLLNEMKKGWMGKAKMADLFDKTVVSADDKVNYSYILDNLY